MAQHGAVESIEPPIEHPLRHLHEADDELPRDRARLAPELHLEDADVQQDIVSLRELGV